MFCPSCGVKYDGTLIQCPSCKKTIPSLDGPRSTPAVAAPRAKPVAGPEHRFGSVGDRMLALFFDRALIAAILLIVAALIAEQRASGELVLPRGRIADFAAGAALLTFVFLYHVICEAGFGATLGKLVMGLQVRNESDRNRFVAVLIRNAMRIVDGIALYLVGFLFATFTSRRQRLGDSIGGTVVLDLPMSKGVRAAMMVLLIAAIGASIWVAWVVCPSCTAPVTTVR